MDFSRHHIKSQENVKEKIKKISQIPIQITIASISDLKYDLLYKT
jgi:hypothetical protein